MEHKEIKILLQKFYDGTASEKEEDRLITYFADNEVDEELWSDRDLLLGFRQIRETDISVPADLQKNLKNALDPLQRNDKVRTLSSAKVYSIISVAASILIIASVFTFMNKTPDLGTYEDPKVAYAETKEALELVSKYFGKGTEHIDNLSKIEEPRKNLEYLKTFDEGIERTKGLIDITK